jgi:hypothetical protein
LVGTVNSQRVWRRCVPGIVAKSEWRKWATGVAAAIKCPSRSCRGDGKPTETRWFQLHWIAMGFRPGCSLVPHKEYAKRVCITAGFLLSLSALVTGCGKNADQTTSAKKDDAQQYSGQNAPAAPKKAGADRFGTFTVGKGTTVVTGPVLKDGHIDDAAALNERLSQGVKPETNAAAGFWKALGPNPMTVGGGTVPPGFFDKLGIEHPPATGDYFVTLVQYTRGGGRPPS